MKEIANTYSLLECTKLQESFSGTRSNFLSVCERLDRVSVCLFTFDSSINTFRLFIVITYFFHSQLVNIDVLTSLTK